MHPLFDLTKKVGQSVIYLIFRIDMAVQKLILCLIKTILTEEKLNFMESVDM